MITASVVQEVRFGGSKNLSDCLVEMANWLKENKKDSEYDVAGIFMWEDTEYGDWYGNIYLYGNLI